MQSSCPTGTTSLAGSRVKASAEMIAAVRNLRATTALPVEMIAGWVGIPQDPVQPHSASE